MRYTRYGKKRSRVSRIEQIAAYSVILAVAMAIIALVVLRGEQIPEAFLGASLLAAGAYGASFLLFP